MKVGIQSCLCNNENWAWVLFSKPSIYIHACLHKWDFSPSLCVHESYMHIFPSLFLADKQFQFRLIMFYCISQMGEEKKSECAIYWNNIYFVSLNNTWTFCFNLSTSVWPPFSLLSLLMMSYYLSSKHRSLLWFLTLVIHVSFISRSHTYLSSHKLNWISYLSGSQKYSYSATGSWLLADIK